MLEGLLLGMLFYLLALFIGIWCYRLYSPLYQKTLIVILICWVGHYIGTFVYSLMLTDSLVQFFPNATPRFNGFNTSFVFNIVWYVRKFFTGDSYIGTVYFFSAFAFLGSILWYLLYIQLAQRLNISNQKYTFPALVLMCWPSYLFFTAGIGKDSLCFFLIPLILLSLNQVLYQKEKSAMMVINLVFSILFLTLIRPYLLMIFVGAYFLSTFKGITKLSGFRVILILCSLPVLYFVAHWVGTAQGGMTSIEIADIAARATRQQGLLNVGTTFPMLSTNPIIVVLLLPYSFTMNLTMPLFVFAHNLTGLFASFENAVLVYLLYTFWKDRKIFKILKNKIEPVKLCFSFFIVGMAFLGLINTNLGLAARQKSMYVPAFLVVAMLVWLYKKQMKRR